MNLLGHLYLSQNESPEARLFNLLGDRFKGRGYTILSTEAQKGIQMHRAIDHFMDSHPAVAQLKQELSTTLPKVSGIALDIFFDYILASEWPRFHQDSLPDFLDTFYSTSKKSQKQIPVDYSNWVLSLQENRYIHRYNHFESVVAISEHLHRKLKFKTEIYTAPIIFSKFESNIRQGFEEYIQDARENFIISRHTW